MSSSEKIPPPPLALITGASSGIGLAMAKELAQKGFSLGLIARTEPRLKEAVDACKELCSSKAQMISSFKADVSNASEMETISSRWSQVFESAPDWLILNAGIARAAEFEKTSTSDFDAMMKTNFFGSLYPLQEFLPNMKKGSRIVFICSGAGISGLYGYSAYGASKFAQRGLAESLRMELKPRGISVTLAYPPDTDTPQLAEENKSKPAVTKALTSQASIWKPDVVAKKILRNAGKKRFLVVPGMMLKLFYGLHADGGWFLRWYLDAIVRRVLKRKRG